MKTASVITSIVLTLTFALATACAKNSGKDPNMAGGNQAAGESTSDSLEPASAWNGEVSQCVDETGDILACGSNEDCCKGFSCGFDPERSRVQRYCLPE